MQGSHVCFESTMLVPGAFAIHDDNNPLPSQAEGSTGLAGVPEAQVAHAGRCAQKAEAGCCQGGGARPACTTCAARCNAGCINECGWMQQLVT
jgi:hypothetical protein